MGYDYSEALTSPKKEDPPGLTIRNISEWTRSAGVSRQAFVFITTKISDCVRVSNLYLHRLNQPNQLKNLVGDWVNVIPLSTSSDKADISSLVSFTLVMARKPMSLAWTRDWLKLSTVLLRIKSIMWCASWISWIILVHKTKMNFAERPLPPPGVADMALSTSFPCRIAHPPSWLLFGKEERFTNAEVVLRTYWVLRRNVWTAVFAVCNYLVRFF